MIISKRIVLISLMYAMLSLSNLFKKFNIRRNGLIVMVVIHPIFVRVKGVFPLTTFGHFKHHSIKQIKDLHWTTTTDYLQQTMCCHRWWFRMVLVVRKYFQYSMEIMAFQHCPLSPQRGLVR